MDDSDGAAPVRHIFKAPTATVIAAVIGCVSAVLSATLPWLLGTHGRTAAVVPSTAQIAPLDAITPIGPRFAAPAAKQNLTFGVWTIVNCVDEAGTDFSGSTLKFDAQQETLAGLDSTGFFEWLSGAEVLGREYFVAQYDAASRQIYIEGKRTESPTNRLAAGSFSARVSDDGRQLLEGRWGNTPGNLPGIPGHWEARR